MEQSQNPNAKPNFNYYEVARDFMVAMISHPSFQPKEANYSSMAEEALNAACEFVDTMNAYAEQAAEWKNSGSSDREST